MSDIEDFLMGIFLLGAVVIVSCIVTGIISNASGISSERDYMQQDAIAHGYAHYDTDQYHSFHWNNEKKDNGQ